MHISADPVPGALRSEGRNDSYLAGLNFADETWTVFLVGCRTTGAQLREARDMGALGQVATPGSLWGETLVYFLSALFWQHFQKSPYTGREDIIDGLDGVGFYL